VKLETFEDETAFYQARADIVDQIEDFVQANDKLDHYSDWLRKFLEHIKNLRRKDFF
jgi:hypothetical protein